MAETTFIIGDSASENPNGTAPLQVQVTITEIAGGDLQVSLQVLSGYIADLTGFFST